MKGSEPAIAEREARMQSEGRKIESARSVLIIRGGSVGVELAGKLVSKWPEKHVALIQGSERLLDSFSKCLLALTGS